jgi:hypothetical protein
MSKRARTEAKTPVLLPDSFGEVWALITSAQEPSEPGLYCFTLEDAPAHMKKQIRHRAVCGQTAFMHLYGGDGADGMDGLVAEEEEHEGEDEGDEEDEEDKADGIIEYLEGKISEDFALRTPFSGTFHLQFTLAQA